MVMNATIIDNGNEIWSPMGIATPPSILTSKAAGYYWNP
jgi:hypothetical protein